MKRVLSLVLCLCLLAFGGCKPKEKPITAVDLLGKPFTCHMDIAIGKADFAGTFSKKSGTSLSFSMTEPELLSGLLFSYDSGKVGVTVGSVSVSLGTEGLPSSAVTNLLFDLYRDTDEQNEITLKEDTVLLRHTGTLDVTVVEFDKATLVPRRLYTEKSDVEIQYSDYRLTDTLTSP